MRARRPVGLALTLALALAGCRDDAGDGAASPVAGAELSRPPPAQDERVAYLLVPGANNSHYDVDTSDPVPILIENLLRGQRDPLRRAREELAALGPEGVRVVQRIVDTYFDQPEGFAHLRNALDVLNRCEGPGVSAACVQLVGHPDDGIAVLAAEALAKRGGPADYDAVRARLQHIGPDFTAKVALALHPLDPPRAEGEYLDWIVAGRLESLWDALLQRVALASDARIVARCSELWPTLPDRYQALCATPCARAGDETALRFLREQFQAQEIWRREIAVQTFGLAGLEDDLARIARSEADPRLRLRAVNELARPDWIERHIDDIRTGLNSPDESLSQACLLALTALGDPAALDRALALVDQTDPLSIAQGMRALHGPMARDPGLARRVLDVLARRRAPEAQLPMLEQVPLLKAIGQVPLAEAAELLLGLLPSARGELSGLPAERWLTQQVGNIGEAGQRLLRARLDVERDPLRRLDLIEGIGVRGGEFALRTMLEIVESDSSSPYEILYAADRAARMGRVQDVAPVLKRVTLRVTQPDVRLALQNFLWANYPGPK